MRASAAVLLCLAVSAPALVSGESVTPIQKVLQMMNDMLSKGIEEKEAETVEFAKYKTFCQMTRKEKETSIAKGKEKIEQLLADMEKADADSMTAAKEISVIDADVAVWEGEKKETDTARATAHADYQTAHAEYEASIDSVNKAMASLEAGGGASSLLQLSSRVHVPEKTRKALMSFLEKGTSHAPEPAAFEGQSGGIKEMVEELGDKFKDEKKELEKAETEEENNHQLLIADLIDQIDDGQRESENKKAFKAQREQDKGDAEGDLAETKANLAEDEKFLKDILTECATNADDYEQRQVARGGEIKAIKKAIEIMSSDKVKGGSAHLPGLVQTADASSLAQLRSEASTSRALQQSLAATFLADRAKVAGSRVLSLLSAKVQADPFKKVTKMIRDMITKLMEEAQEEAEHKGFCDAEMGTNKVTRDQKTTEVSKLQADVDELTADIAKLSTEAADLSALIAESDARLGEATAIRTEAKTKNQATIADSTVAAAAVAQALAVLKEYYEGVSASFAQTDDDSAPSVSFSSQATAIQSGASLVQEPYTGMASGGIVGMLETIESDFTRLISETTAAEAEEEKAYKKFKQDSDQNKAVKSSDLKYKETTKTEKESKLQDAKKDLGTTQEELDAALAYFEKLKPSCVDAGESYEERVARRKEEIESLKEALKILSE